MSVNELAAGYARYTTADEIGVAAGKGMGLMWPTSLTSPATTVTGITTVVVFTSTPV